MKLSRGRHSIAREGMHDTVIIRVEDLGVVQDKFADAEDPQMKLRVVFQTQQLGNDKRPLEVTEDYRQTIHTKSKFTKLLTALGVMNPPEGYDPQSIVGKSARVIVQHRVDARTGNTYANVAHVMPAGVPR